VAELWAAYPMGKQSDEGGDISLSGTVNARDSSDLEHRYAKNTLACRLHRESPAAPRTRSAARTHVFYAVACARRASRASLRRDTAISIGFRVRKERSDLWSAVNGKSRVGD